MANTREGIKRKSAGKVNPEPAPWAEVMRYRNDAVVDRFLAHYNVPRKTALKFFRETKRWLWLCAKAQRLRQAGLYHQRMIIDDDLLFIDEMWHHFILFTRDYKSFCLRYFGVFIHHNPTPEMQKKTQRSTVEESQSKFEKLLSNSAIQCGFIYDHAGENILRDWYTISGKIYTRAWLRSVRR